MPVPILHSMSMCLTIDSDRGPAFDSESHFDLTGPTFDCNPDPTSVFDPSSGLCFAPDPACDSVPIRFYSRPVHNSLQHSAFNPDFATSHNSDLDEAGII
ncbi:hypothetical protein EVAR_27208_1 [Eumeta japonica]|uniref:Uncharacterized protein n=1 Tax=Eumeta variegata TaxID=151549 RepID=A0A4C1VYG5_EUMVA|nr:hypothetical protein EVAR_27208_1 [Eumeta japonica]